MRKFVLCVLVIIITFITVVAMTTLKSDLASETSNIPSETMQTDGKPDGTGYIFDDFNRGINIPVNQLDETSMESAPNTKGSIRFLSYRGFKMRQQELREALAPAPAEYTAFARAFDRKYILENRETAQRIESRMSPGDKLYLVSMAKALNINDILTIKEAMENGATFEEVDKIWNKLKEKLPREEYDRLVGIINKYYEEQ